MHSFPAFWDKKHIILYMFLIEARNQLQLNHSGCMLPSRWAAARLERAGFPAVFDGVFEWRKNEIRKDESGRFGF